ncbi:hypothetical protein [Deefgea sp. CFH1-16]|uniref:hypothetical protein n=1 Tax=Deefgea sp. CFH1-16 TaxID=2675457 RepID=UPI0015F37463|nr:hypothetical protein [Deefgea sp. CFH1-16]MBM5573861.1 hypothetical protein [Deefgea sp. CFH1-16]
MPKQLEVQRTQHDIVFNPSAVDQTVAAARFLAHLNGIQAQAYPAEHKITISYSLCEYALLDIEQQLQNAGFELDTHFWQKIKREFVHYSETVQRDNLAMPEHNLKSPQIYIHAWEKHQHGDHDDTPEELRRYL